MKTLDDRDQQIELFHLPRSQLRQPLVIPMKLSEGQRRRNDRVTRVGAIYSAFPILTVLAMWISGDVLSGRTKLVVSFILAAFVILELRIWIRRIDRIDAIHWLVAYRNCGACGHSLEGLKPQEDGCCVCPECGAAWQAPTW